MIFTKEAKHTRGVTSESILFDHHHILKNPFFMISSNQAHYKCTASQTGEQPIWLYIKNYPMRVMNWKLFQNWQHKEPPVGCWWTTASSYRSWFLFSFSHVQVWQVDKSHLRFFFFWAEEKEKKQKSYS